MAIVCRPSVCRACLLSLASLTLSAWGCTPLLGGDVACNDSGDCPDERPHCRDEVCRKLPDPSEGEGEQPPPFAVTLSMATAQPAFPEEDVTLTFVAERADTCTLDFDLLPRNPRVLTGAELSAGSITLTATHQEVADLVEASGGVQAAIARLTCVRGPDQASAVALARWDQGFRTSFTADPVFVPIAGGAVQLCWSAPVGATCDVAATDGTPLVVGQPPEGCTTATLGDTGGNPANHAFQLTCLKDGITAPGTAGVVQGAGLLRFAPSSNLLLGPSAVTLDWQAFAARCELATWDRLINDTFGPTLSTATEGSIALAIEADTTFSLKCFSSDGTQVGHGVFDIAVGPVLREAIITSPNVGSYMWRYSSRLVRTCALVLTSGDRTAGDPEAPRFNPGERRVFAPDGDAPVDVTISCDGFAGPASLRATFEPTRPPRIVNPHYLLEGAPAGLHPVSMCWESLNAARCVMLNDDDGAEVPLNGCVTEQIEDGLYRQLICLDEDNLALTDHFFELGGYTTASLSARPRVLPAGGPVTFSWTGQNISSCELRDGTGAVRSSQAAGTLAVQVEDNETFTLDCQGNDGPTGDSVTILVGPQITNLTALADAAADHLDISWNAENVERCALTVDNGHGTLTLDNLAPYTAHGVQSPLFRPIGAGLTFWFPLNLAGAGDTDVTLACDDGVGGLVEESLVVGEPTQAEILTLQATPAALPLPGGDVDACWSSQGSTGCSLWTMTADDFETLSWTDVPTTGCLSTSTGTLAITETVTMRLMCFAVIGGDDAEILVPVGPYVRNFSSTPTHLTADGTVILAWDVANVDACVVRDALGTEVGSGGAAASVSTALDETTRFTLDCDDGTVTRDLYVAVGPSILRLEVRPSDDRLGFFYTLQTALVQGCELRAKGEDDYAIPARRTEDGACDDVCENSVWWPFGVHGAPTVRAICDVGDGTTIEATATGTIPDLPGPDTTLTVTPAWLPAPGGDFEVCWSAPDADLCFFDGGPEVATFGCETRTASSEAEVRLTCAGPDGLADRMTRILVGPAVRSFTASPASLFIDEGNTVTLSWETEAVTSCTLIGGPFENVPVGPAGPLELTFEDVEMSFGLHLWCNDADGPPPGEGADATAYLEIATW